MRGARWLLLVAMVVIVGAVDLTYRAQKKVLRNLAPVKPAALSPDLNFSAEHYHLRKNSASGTLVEIDADDFRQAKDSDRVEMRGVLLKLYNKAGDAFDLVQSAAATFFSNQDRLYSDGDVEVTLAVPTDGEPKSNLISIRSSGVNFDTNTGRADTDRPATFTFSNGEGKSKGASYDPNTRDLIMKENVEVNWHVPGSEAPPTKIEAARLWYHEATSEIWLKPWGRLTRQNTIVEGYDSTIHLQDKKIKQLETNRAQGTDTYPNRKLQYAADHVLVDFNEDGEVETIHGDGNARLVSTAEGAETTLTAARVEMNFEPQAEQSVLTRVNATGKSTATSKPLPVPGRQPSETHVLRSDVIEMKMRPGGREIESVVTHSPAQLEFFPSLPSQHHRVLDTKDLAIAYGPQSHIDSLHAVEVKTLTDPTEDEVRRNQVSARTASREMLARFEPNSNQISTLDQSGDFTYEAGVRKARAAKASLNQKDNVMVLDTNAHIWDDTGSTFADHIRMDQRTGDFLAEGNVRSTRLPDKEQKTSSMLSADEPLQSQARKMASSDRNRKVHYEGDVKLWQGANRLAANVVDVDREKQMIVADGNVVTDLWEKPKNSEEQKPAKAPTLTVTHAAHLVYTDQDRLALYTGGVVLNRPDMQVKARELRAFLNDDSADSRLNHAIADGAVEIVQRAHDRTRTGTADHAEYYTDQEKVVLNGGKPQLVDSLRGMVSGVQLTYYANDDRLQAEGSKDHLSEGQFRHSK
jgi:lipopolysaccharide export system protein LptA